MLRVPRISQATARNRAMSRALLTTRLDSRLFPSGHGPWIWPGRGNLCQQVTFDLKSGGRLAGVAVDLNGEVPGGPLDAFFMSRPRYTQRENDLASRLALSLSLSLSLSTYRSFGRFVRSVSLSPTMRFFDNTKVDYTSAVSASLRRTKSRLREIETQYIRTA